MSSQGQTQNDDQLKDAEQGLYRQLEAAIAANSGAETQQQIIAQINKIKEARISKFSTMTSMFDALKNNVSKTLNNFIDEMSDSIHVVQGELDKSKSRLDKVEEIKNNKQRMAEINTYYGKQYKENTSTMKTIMYFSLPIVVLLILRKNGVLPENVLNTLITLILIVGGFVIIRKIFINTFMRDNMNYDEINQLINSDQMGPTVIQYDLNQLEGNNLEADIRSDASYLAAKLGFACIGSSCCSNGMIFDDAEKKCVVKAFNANVNSEYQKVHQ